MLNIAELYYFSPTGGTKKAGKIFCEGISKNVKTVDLSLRDKAVEKPEGELVVIAVPVFGGRIPAIAAERLNKLEGSGKKAVTLVIYGNRAYEDALLELNNIVTERGFQVAASAALVAQHSMAPEVGKGRPDEQDRRSILEFAGKVLDKLESGSESPVKVPGNYPYKNGMSMLVTPVSLPSCKQCGKCATVCPTGAIQIENGAAITSPERCILCMACVSACPEHARILPPPLQEKMEQMLGALKSVRRENEFFL
ncbi:MAG: EFR1 family ferrodoxin [Eubacteriales bacterium]|nr:EFR1 family ferrodoxin [Eubacteriales bacterium]